MARPKEIQEETVPVGARIPKRIRDIVLESLGREPESQFPREAYEIRADEMEREKRFSTNPIGVDFPMSGSVSLRKQEMTFVKMNENLRLGIEYVRSEEDCTILQDIRPLVKQLFELLNVVIRDRTKNSEPTKLKKPSYISDRAWHEEMEKGYEKELQKLLEKYDKLPNPQAREQGEKKVIDKSEAEIKIGSVEVTETIVN